MVSPGSIVVGAVPTLVTAIRARGVNSTVSTALAAAVELSECTLVAEAVLVTNPAFAWSSVNTCDPVHDELSPGWRIVVCVQFDNAASASDTLKPSSVDVPELITVNT